MSFNLASRVTRLGPLLTKGSRRFASIHEPNYLHLYQPEIPPYLDLNIQIRGQTYSVLESYQKFVSKILKQLDIDVEDSYAFPHKEFLVSRYSENTTVAEAQFKLKFYERDIHVSNVPSTRYSILIRVLEAALPEGMTLNVDQFDPAYEEKRYIPDAALISLREELEEMKKPKK